MEADDLGPKLLDDRAHLRIERQAQRAAVAGLDAEFVIIRPQQRPPGAVVGLPRHRVAEEVEVERARRSRARTAATCSRTCSGDSIPQGSDPSAPPSIAATHSSTPPAPAIGAWTIGCSVPDEVEEAAVGPAYHAPVFGIDAQGSAGASAAPFCSSSIEMLSGVRTNAMRPSRGGRLIVTPASISRWQVS